MSENSKAADDKVRIEDYLDKELAGQKAQAKSTQQGIDANINNRRVSFPSANQGYVTTVNPTYKAPSDPLERKICYLLAKWFASDADDDLFNAMKSAHEEWEQREFGV